MSKKLDGLRVGGEIATSNGGRCLSTEYVNQSTKMQWQCKDNHIWDTTLKSIKNGHWCPYCAGQRLENGIKEAKEIAIVKGGVCLSDEYINMKNKLLWQCGCGNQWNANLNNIKRGRWCPECGKKKSGKKRLSYDYVQKQIENRGGKLLSDTYNGVGVHLKIKCSNDHVFKMKYGNIRSGHWCKYCSFGKNQTLLANIIQDIIKTDVEQEYNKFDWLKTSLHGKQRIDIFVPSIKLAIEYDGEQHFKPVRFSNISWAAAEKLFKRTKRMDKIKNKKIAANKDDVFYFVRFNYMETLTYDYVYNKLRENGVPV